MRFNSDLDAPLVNPRYAPRNAQPIPPGTIASAPNITLTVNAAWFSHLIGVIEALDQPDAWQGTETQIENARAEIRKLIANAEEATTAMTFPLGFVIPSGALVATVPDWFLLCDGSTYNRVDYPDLYDVLESAFIVDVDTFMVPNLSDNRTIVGASSDIGAVGGSATHTLTVNEMPSHSHQRGSANAWILQDGPAPPGSGEGGYVTQPGTGAFFYKKNNTNSSGSGAAHNNMPPHMKMRWYMVAKYP